MKSWLAGFLTFGFMYTLIIVAIFALDWPTLKQPHLYGTMESKLPESLLGSVLKVLVKSEQLSNIDDVATYKIAGQSFRLKDGSLTDAIVIVNGNVIVLKKNTPPDVATEIAVQYVGSLEKRVEKMAEDYTFRLTFLLLLPLTLITMFAFSSRWLWNKLLLLR